MSYGKVSATLPKYRDIKKRNKTAVTEKKKKTPPTTKKKVIKNKQRDKMSRKKIHKSKNIYRRNFFAFSDMEYASKNSCGKNFPIQ